MKWIWKSAKWIAIVSFWCFLLWLAYCADLFITEGARQVPFIKHAWILLLVVTAFWLCHIFERLLSRIAETLDAIRKSSDETREQMQQLKWAIEEDRRVQARLWP